MLKVSVIFSAITFVHVGFNSKLGLFWAVWEIARDFQVHLVQNSIEWGQHVYCIVPRINYPKKLM